MDVPQMKDQAPLSAALVFLAKSGVDIATAAAVYFLWSLWPLTWENCVLKNQHLRKKWSESDSYKYFLTIFCNSIGKPKQEIKITPLSKGSKEPLGQPQ